MENKDPRVKKACDRCRQKKTKCDGQEKCGRCAKDDAICQYKDIKRRKTTAGASLAAENEELKQALKTDAVTNESVHDMVAHIRTLKRQADDVDVTDFQDTLSRDGSPVRFPADTQPGNELHTPTVLPIQTQRSHLEEGMSYNDTENVMAVQEAYTMADQDSAQALELLERWYSGRNGYLGVWDTYR